MASKALPCPTLLRQLLRCDPVSGRIFWLTRPREMFTSDRTFGMWNARYAGTEAFTAKNGSGYKNGSINGKNYQAHRVIWAMHHGSWPVNEIDHINGIRDDNRIVNLRDVSQGENQRNARRRIDNESGHCGVSWRKESRRWRAEIRLNGKQKNLGYFTDIDDAIAARKAAEIKNGYTERHGRTA